MTRKICYYHSGIDGFTAAWILSKVIPDVELVEVRHNQKYPEIVPGANVYLLDHTFNSYGYMEELIDQSNYFMHLDNNLSHKPYINEMDERFNKRTDNNLEPRYNFVFEEDKSGALLTWEEFGWGDENNPPTLVWHVNEGDMGRKTGDVEIYCEGLRSVDRTLAEWDRLQDPSEFKKLWELGNKRVKDRESRCHRAINRWCHPVLIEMTDRTQRKIPITRATFVSDMIKQAKMMVDAGLGSADTDRSYCGVVGVIHVNQKQYATLTLASPTNECSVDVGELCEYLSLRNNGGGRENIAGLGAGLYSMLDSDKGLNELAEAVMKDMQLIV